jgi:hypothetical protein
MFFFAPRCSANFEKEHFFGSANYANSQNCSGNFKSIYRTIYRTQNQKIQNQKIVNRLDYFRLIQLALQNLAGLYSIDSVSIANRWCNSPSDPLGCLCRLSNASVSLLDENDAVIATTSTNNTCGVSQLLLGFPAPCPTVPPPKCLPNTRKIKLEQFSTGQHIRLFELQALTSLGINVQLKTSLPINLQLMYKLLAKAFPHHLQWMEIQTRSLIQMIPKQGLKWTLVAALKFHQSTS